MAQSCTVSFRAAIKTYRHLRCPFHPRLSGFISHPPLPCCLIRLLGAKEGLEAVHQGRVLWVKGSQGGERGQSEEGKGGKREGGRGVSQKRGTGGGESDQGCHARAGGQGGGQGGGQCVAETGGRSVQEGVYKRGDEQRGAGAAFGLDGETERGCKAHRERGMCARLVGLRVAGLLGSAPLHGAPLLVDAEVLRGGGASARAEGTACQGPR